MLFTVGETVTPAHALFECQNQNPVDPDCEPYEMLDIKILPGPIPQFVYQTRVQNPTGTDDSENYRGFLESPLGYIATAVGPVPVQADPVKTYWVKSIQNLTTEPVTVVECTSGYDAQICGVNGFATRVEHRIQPRQTKDFQDPTNFNGYNGHLMFPNTQRGQQFLTQQQSSNVDVPFNLTLLENKRARGLFVFHRYNCAFANQNFCPANPYRPRPPLLGLPI